MRKKRKETSHRKEVKALLLQRHQEWKTQNG